MTDELHGFLGRLDGKDVPVVRPNVEREAAPDMVRVESEGYGTQWVPLGQGRARVVEYQGQRCEHVSELADGTWVYRPKAW
jgi:hypothetical protein